MTFQNPTCLSSSLLSRMSRDQVFMKIKWIQAREEITALIKVGDAAAMTRIVE